MTWSDIKRKLTSRKFWAAIAGAVTNIIIACGGGTGDAGRVAAIIMAGAVIIAYIVGEGLVDAASAGYADGPKRSQSSK